MNQGRKYHVLYPLGKGGFGTVYRADVVGEGGFTKSVALKVLNPDMEQVEEVARRFRDEARVLGLIRHRAIVQVDGLVRLANRWTVVMEYVSGVDLHRLHKQGPMPVGPALEIVGEVAGALEVAYTSAGPDGSPLHLLHRDIKPANIQLTPAGEVKVLDFGIARAEFAGREAATRSLMFGSEGYMAPERHDFIDGPAGDVYALGVVLWELLTAGTFGRTSAHPSRHEEKVNTAQHQLWEVTGGDNEELIRFVGDLLAYEPGDRPTAREVESRLWTLHRAIRGERLREWAERVVPPLMESRKPIKDDELSGSVLTESFGGELLDSPPTDPSERATTEPKPPTPVEVAASQTWGVLGAAPASEAIPPQVPAPAPRRRRRPLGLALLMISALSLSGVLLAGTGLGLGAWFLQRDPALPTEVESIELPPSFASEPPPPQTALPVSTELPEPEEAPVAQVQAASKEEKKSAPAARPTAATGQPAAARPPSAPESTTKVVEESEAPAPPTTVVQISTGDVGTLYVRGQTSQGAVIVDGVPMGRSRWRGDIAPGEHQVVLRGDDGKQASAPVVVHAGQDTYLCLDLSRGGLCR